MTMSMPSTDRSRVRAAGRLGAGQRHDRQRQRRRPQQGQRTAEPEPARPWARAAKRRVAENRSGRPAPLHPERPARPPPGPAGGATAPRGSCQMTSRRIDSTPERGQGERPPGWWRRRARRRKPSAQSHAAGETSPRARTSPRRTGRRSAAARGPRRPAGSRRSTSLEELTARCTPGRRTRSARRGSRAPCPSRRKWNSRTRPRAGEPFGAERRPAPPGCAPGGDGAAAEASRARRCAR